MKVIPAAPQGRLFFLRAVPPYVLFVAGWIADPEWVSYGILGGALVLMARNLITTHNEAVLATDEIWREGLERLSIEQTAHDASLN